MVWNMLLALLFDKGPKFGHLEFKPADVREHHPVAHILEEFVSWGRRFLHLCSEHLLHKRVHILGQSEHTNSCYTKIFTFYSN
jgi:hypothetical protein